MEKVNSVAKEVVSKVLVGTVMLWLGVFLVQQLGISAKEANQSYWATNPVPNCGNGHFQLIGGEGVPSWIIQLLDSDTILRSAGPFCSGTGELSSQLYAYGSNPEQVIIQPGGSSVVTVTNNSNFDALIQTPPAQPGHDLVITGNTVRVICWKQADTGMRLTYVNFAGGSVTGEIPLTSIDEVPSVTQNALQPPQSPAVATKCEHAWVELPSGAGASIQQIKR